MQPLVSEIVLPAREHLRVELEHAIARDARATTPSATPVAAADVGAVSSFLTRERDFLQSLGRLVQGHAESVKSMAQSARSADAKPSAPAS